MLIYPLKYSSIIIVPPNQVGYTALIWAAMVGNEVAVEFLLEVDASPHITSYVSESKNSSDLWTCFITDQL